MPTSPLILLSNQQLSLRALPPSITEALFPTASSEAQSRLTENPDNSLLENICQNRQPSPAQVQTVANPTVTPNFVAKFFKQRAVGIVIHIIMHSAQFWTDPRPTCWGNMTTSGQMQCLVLRTLSIDRSACGSGANWSNTPCRVTDTLLPKRRWHRAPPRAGVSICLLVKSVNQRILLWSLWSGCWPGRQLKRHCGKVLE